MALTENGFVDEFDEPQERAKTPAEKFAEFELDHPDIAAWWKESTFEFALSLKQQLMRKGSLSDKQVAAAQKCALKAKQAMEFALAAKLNPPPTINISAIETALSKGKLNKIGSPKLRLLNGEDSFTFSFAPAYGKNAGSIYVVSGDIYLGKITDGRFIRSRDCTDENERSVLEACANPEAAAVAYGQRFGACSCCGRTLTNGISIDLGIGPICREKFFG